ncbi:MAG: segregation/condensation protein A [Candidatus Micrarchaeia archaeon]
MATSESVAVQKEIETNGFNIERIVREITWKEIIIDLVRRNRLNPWEINIVELIDQYIGELKNMKVVDLKLPANVLLAAAILLRLKSEVLKLEEEQPEESQGVPEEKAEIVIPELRLRLRVPPKRKITLDELLAALDEAMKIKEFKAAAVREEKISLPVYINLETIEKLTNALFEEITGIVDSYSATTFSILSQGKSKEEALMNVFIPLLFLEQSKKIALMQEKFFEEIIIRLVS